MTFSFKGHTVVVTGAGGGLGKASVSPLLAAFVTRLSYHLQLLTPVCGTGSQRRRERCQRECCTESRG